MKYENRIVMAVLCAVCAVNLANFSGQLHTMQDFNVVKWSGVVGWLVQMMCWLRLGCKIINTDGSQK